MGERIARMIERTCAAIAGGSRYLRQAPHNARLHRDTGQPGFMRVQSDGRACRGAPDNNARALSTRSQPRAENGALAI
jgi:hypothetical protein